MRGVAKRIGRNRHGRDDHPAAGVGQPETEHSAQAGVPESEHHRGRRPRPPPVDVPLDRHAPFEERLGEGFAEGVPARHEDAVLAHGQWADRAMRRAGPAEQGERQQASHGMIRRTPTQRASQ